MPLPPPPTKRGAKLSSDVIDLSTRRATARSTATATATPASRSRAPAQQARLLTDSVDEVVTPLPVPGARSPVARTEAPAPARPDATGADGSGGGAPPAALGWLPWLLSTFLLVWGVMRFTMWDRRWAIRRSFRANAAVLDVHVEESLDDEAAVSRGPGMESRTAWSSHTDVV